MEGIQQLNTAMRDAFPESNRASRTYMEIVSSHDVTKLTVVGACEEVEDWLEKMKDTLESMKCLASKWVNTAGYFMQGNARYWWKSVKKSHPPNSLMTWVAFRRLFREHFMSPSYQLRKRQ